MYFEGTPNETDTCPRRHLRRNPDLIAAFHEHRKCDGVPGMAASDVLSAAGFDALATISDARAEKLEEDLREAVKNGSK